MELPLTDPNPHSWRSLPTTKVRRPSPNSAFSWTYTYTAFSLEFAQSAIRHLGVRPDSLIFDPFLGSGTTMVAAALEGARSFGVDISPFAALLARARIAVNADGKRVGSYLKAKSRSAQEHATSASVINAHDSAYVRGVIYQICRAHNISGQDLWPRILEDEVGQFDNEVVAIASLALAARVVANLERGSNPIWYRQRAIEIENSNSDVFRAASIEIAQKITSDLSTSEIATARFRIKNGDFLSMNRLPKFDTCVTSPPYLNRLDYVVAHLPELSVLQMLFPFSLDELKRSMIGTTKIVGKFGPEVPRGWGETGEQVMDAVLNHSSYASARYYYHNYFSYFDRLFASLVQLVKFMRKNAHGIIVLQDSFYKDLPIPTATICAEMLEQLSCDAEVVRSTSVQTHMGRLSPTQVTYAPKKTLNESLVYFRAPLQ
nr:DNA methyltransferase [Bradyrhizobium elkanii]